MIKHTVHRSIRNNVGDFERDPITSYIVPNPYNLPLSAYQDCGWCVVEDSTGLSLSWGETRKQAIAEALAIIERKGLAEVHKVIDFQAKKYSIPLPS